MTRRKRAALPFALILLWSVVLSACTSIATGYIRYPNFSYLYHVTKESVVYIDVKTDSRLVRFLGSSAGSGIIFSSEEVSSNQFETLVLTNYHVVSGAKSIKVAVFSREDYSAQILGFDEPHDLAVLKILTTKRQKTATFEDSDELTIGEFAYAIGNPHDYLWSFSLGTIGNLAQDLVMDAILFDGSLGPGNSGGGLFNSRGELVGITYGVVDNGGLMGFAVSINLVKKELLSMLKGGRVIHGYLGVDLKMGVDVTEMMASKMSIPFPVPWEDKAIVVAIGSDGAGELKLGDVILTVNGITVRRIDHIVKLVLESPIGSLMTIKILRKNKELTLKIKVKERPQS